MTSLNEHKTKAEMISLNGHKTIAEMISLKEGVHKHVMPYRDWVMRDMFSVNKAIPCTHYYRLFKTSFL